MFKYKVNKRKPYQYASQGIIKNLQFEGSDDKRSATYGAKTSNSSKSFRALSDPGRDTSIKFGYCWSLKLSLSRYYNSKQNIHN